MRDEILAIYKAHSFRIGGKWFCSFDSVYDDLRDLFPHKNHDQICELMEITNELLEFER